MKLLLVLLLIACSHADKLDRTYLPPPSAASAGGSPGSLMAPLGSSSEAGLEQPGFGSQYRPNSASEPQRPAGFGQPSGQGSFGQQAGSSGFRRPSAPNRFEVQSGGSQASAGYGQSSSRPSGQSGFGQASAAPSSDNKFGSTPSAQPTGSIGFGQPSVSSSEPSGQSGYGSGPQSSFGGPSEYEQQSGSPRFGPTKQQGAAGFSQASSGFNQDQASSGFNQAQTSSGFNQGQAPSVYNQGPASGSYESQAPQQPERPQAEDDRNAQILRYDSENDGERFAYSFETSNGITAEESGVATNGVQAQGAFAYNGDDGERYSVTYTADERGYLPQGDHLPTPPPIPDEILRSIEENARAAAAGTQEGAYNPDEDDSVSPQQYNSGSAPAIQPNLSGSNQFNADNGNELEPTSPQGPQRLSQQQYSKPQSQGFDATTGYASSGPVATNDSPQQYRPQAQKPNQQFGNAPASAKPQSAPYDYNRPQAVRPSSQFGISGGNDNKVSSEPQQYTLPQGQAQQSVSNRNKPSVGSQDLTQQFNRPQGQGSLQQFGSSNGYAPSKPIRPQDSVQQYNRPQAQGPSQQLGATNGNKPIGPQESTQQYRPQSSSGQANGNNAYLGTKSSSNETPEESSYQYNKPQNAGPFGANNGAPKPFAQKSQGNAQVSGIQNQRPVSSPSKPFNQRPQPNNRPQYNQVQQGSGTMNADESGYDYTAPQGTPFASGNQGRPQSPSQARPQFNRPAAQQYSGPQPSGPQQFNRPASPRPQPQGFRPNQGSGAATVSGSQGTFGGSQTPGQYKPVSSPEVPMLQSAPYNYNQPGSSQESQSGSQNFGAKHRGETFGGPRQPPSFDSEEGYKY